MNDEPTLRRPPTPHRVRNLSTLSGVRQELVRLYRAGRKGELGTQDMTRFAFVLRIIANVIETADFEKRLAALERAAEAVAAEERKRAWDHTNGVSSDSKTSTPGAQ